MKGSRIIPLAALAVILVAPVLAYSRGQAPPAPKPGPEHEVLNMDVGTWDATVELSPGPGPRPRS